MHPFVLSWLVGRLLWVALRRTYVRFGFSRLLRVVNSTNCYPCRVTVWESGRIEVLEGPNASEADEEIDYSSEQF